MIYHVTKNRNGRKVARPVPNRQALMALRDAEANREALRKVRSGDESAKSGLLQLAYNLGHVDGTLAGCRSIGSFFFHDIDFYSDEQAASAKETILTRKESIGLVMLERSARGGWHLVCRRERGRTILENQVRVASILQMEMDTSAHDLQRVVYTTSAAPEDLVYLDDDLFGEPMSADECAREYELLRIREQRGQEEVPPGARRANKHFCPWRECAASVLPEVVPMPSETAADGTSAADATSLLPAADDRTRFIAQGVMKTKGLEPADFINEGGRHTSVKMLLSGVTPLLTKDEANGVLAELMPAHWNDPNIRQLVNDFYTKYNNPSQRLLRYQENLFTQSRRLTPTDGEPVEVPDVPPAMPERLPRLISLLTSRTPAMYKAAVAHAVFPPLATHLCGVRFRYTDNVEHEATLMNCLMAGTGAGKGCIDEPIRRIMADIKQRDDENTRREAEWKKENSRRGANKDKMARPEGLVIQQIDPDMTKPALVTRMDEAEGHFVYVKLNELDLFEQLKGQTGKQHFQLMCLAFDPGAEYGQTRVGTQSVTARPVCRFNWNACTTVQKGRRFFRPVLTDGPISRINFCTIPEDEIGSEQPVYGHYDAEFDEALRPYIENLCVARGLIVCPQALRLALQMQKLCADFARLSQSEVYWNLSHRACVIAWLKACVLYVAGGQRWERSIEEFVRWSLAYDLWCKMHFFADDIARSNRETERIGTRGPRNLLELLPAEFTLDDARRVRQQQGLNNDGYRVQRMVKMWISRGYIKQKEEQNFQKVTVNRVKG